MYGFYLLYLSVKQSLVWWFAPIARFKLYNRSDEPGKFWSALCTTAFMGFFLWVIPFAVFAFVLLQRLVELCGLQTRVEIIFPDSGDSSTSSRMWTRVCSSRDSPQTALYDLSYNETAVDTAEHILL